MEDSEYTRVTSVLGAFTDWSKIPHDILEAKKELGTLVHRVIELYLNGHEVHVMPDEAAGYYSSFKEFCKSFNHTWDLDSVEVEKRLYCNDHMITGQMDMIVKGKGKTYIFDWKTSAAKYKSYDLQAAAYRYLAMANGYENVDPVAIVRLKKDGSKPVLSKESDDMGSLEMFFKAFDVYKFFNMEKNNG